MLTDISPELKEYSLEVMQNATSQIFKINCEIYNSSHSISITLPYIDKLEIHQMFSSGAHSEIPSAYMDKIIMQAKLTVDEYLKIMDSHQDMFIAITYYPMRVTDNKAIQNADPLTYVYRFIIANSEDLAKSQHIRNIKHKQGSFKHEGHTALRFTAVFQLFEDKTYLIRHKQVNTLLRDVTLKDVCYHMASLFGVGKISMVEPDNTHRYDHVTIPPCKSFSNIFDFIQDRYGVYAKGLEYYYVNGVLYIYPPYETTPDWGETLHIYNLPKNSFSGNSGYHYVDENKSVHIISNSGVHMENMVEMGIENTQNSIAFTRSDTMLDGFSNTSNSGSKVPNNNVVTCDLYTQKGMSKGAIVSKYKKPTNNPFKYTSELAKSNCKILTMGWSNAKPYLILPGHKLLYHHDQDEAYSLTTGICEQARYSLLSVQHTDVVLYSFTAALMVRLNDEDLV